MTQTEENQTFREEIVSAAVSDAEWTSPAMLVVHRGPNAGFRFPLDHTVMTAGRDPRSDIFLDDATVSRHHAEFHWERGELQLNDIGSLNGNYVNDQPIDSAVLINGDRIQKGKFRLVLLIRPATGLHRLPSAVDESACLPLK